MVLDKTTTAAVVVVSSVVIACCFGLMLLFIIPTPTYDLRSSKALNCLISSFSITKQQQGQNNESKLNDTLSIHESQKFAKTMERQLL